MGQSNFKEKYEYDFRYEVNKLPNGWFQNFSPYDYTFNLEFPEELRGVVTEDEYIRIGNYIKFLSGEGSPHKSFLHIIPFIIMMIISVLLFATNIDPLKSSNIVFILNLIIFVAHLPGSFLFLYRFYKVRKEFKESFGNRVNNFQVRVVPRFRGYLLAFLFIFYAHCILVSFARFYSYFSDTITSADIRILVILLLFIDFVLLFFFLFNVIVFSKYRTYLTCMSYSTQYENQFTKVLTEKIEKYMKPVPQVLFYNRPINQTFVQSQAQYHHTEIEINNSINKNNNSQYSAVLPSYSNLYSNIDIDSEHSQKLLNNNNI